MTDFDIDIVVNPATQQQAEASGISGGLPQPGAPASCSLADGERTQSSMRPNCRNTATCRAKTPGKHCSGCSLAALRSDPKFEARRAAAYRKRVKSDPDFRAVLAQRSLNRLAECRLDPEHAKRERENSLAALAKANTKEVLEQRSARIRERKLGWCPQDRRKEYETLRRFHGAKEARRIMEADINRHGPIAEARRAIAEFDRQQRERHEREQREAY